MHLDLLPRKRLVITALVVALGACSGGQAPSTRPAPGPTPTTTASAVPPPGGVAPTGSAPAQSGVESAPATASAAPAAPPVAAPPPLPTGTRILHLGDSMAGALGLELNRQLKELGLKPTLKFETSSFIPTWAGSTELASYLAQYDPDLVLVTLGMNELKMDDPHVRAPTIQRLVKRFGERPCVWIAPPPLLDGTNELATVIRAHCAPCRFMDTNAVYPDMPRLGDKIHPTLPARTEWAKRVIDWLARNRDPQGAKPWSLVPEP